MTQLFRAFVVNKSKNSFESGIRELNIEDLPDEDVLIRVGYSSINFKDGLASIPDGRVAQTYPLIPGIDLAGTVLSSRDARFREGDQVLVSGYGLGVSHHGGFSEFARVPGDWVIPLPERLTVKEAMVLGTAGFTAALSVKRLEQHGLKPENGPVLVTGATGGVGSISVAILAKRNYYVVASTGKDSEHPFLHAIGAKEIIPRDEILRESERPLESGRWAAAIDPVGGKVLSYLLRTINKGGSVALSGLTGGPHFTSTVFPFILRGINLLGIAADLPREQAIDLWSLLAEEMKPDHLSEIAGREIPLDELPAALASILRGEVRGRIIIKL